jgi:hypothetical protein
MTQFAICTSVYEAGRPYLGQWIVGAVNAAKGLSVRAVVAVDDLLSPEESLRPLSEAMELTVVTADRGSTVANVRRTMFSAARESRADIVVFCDMDDWLLETAFKEHAETLKEADISYGDLRIVDRVGNSMGRNFFDGNDVPDRTENPGQLTDRNWLGLSNTAILGDCLSTEVMDVPNAVIAVDWWFFSTLLRMGRQGGRAATTVAAYRMHDANILGSKASVCLSDVHRRIAIIERHFECFQGDPHFSRRTKQLIALKVRCEREPDQILRQLENYSSRSHLWHEDITRLLDPTTG